MSHPSRVRGLKYRKPSIMIVLTIVAPFTGAWIEIVRAAINEETGGDVAPFTGAWIEIAGGRNNRALPATSHPSRVRGLKFCKYPLVCRGQSSRTLHGCVD